ncbi:MAG: hypothetical protein P1V36_14660, partial [Planctomycetota bacterium]|nr:hypothetical protein [Planctomycetota bacterium]
MTFRNLLIAATLLVISGCGCNDDSTPPGSTPPVAIPARLGVKTRVPPIPVPPPTVVQPFKIDVAFILDDGDHMIDKVLGILPDNQPDDKRTRMQGAQAIFRNVEANIQQRFEDEWVAQHPGTTPPPIDLAFAVARFEDFGGPFAEARNRGNAQDPDITSRNNDRDTRPFILNMPILRQAHPNFGTYFADAIEREAPGDGHPFFELFQGTFARAADPQSGIEALWQVAAPTAANGDIGGFDADGNGTTLGSGAPTTQGVGCVVEIPIGTVNGGPFQAGEDLTFSPSGARGVALEDTADGATVLRYIITEFPNDPENDTTTPAQAGDTVLGLLSGTTTTTTAAGSLVDVNPQTCPGATGDVPAVRFQPYPAATLLPAGTNAAGQDDDGEPLFQVADENGTPVSIPNPAGGAGIPSPASGNIGQVGWRPEAARFAILSSSLATVSPTETTPQGTPELPGLLPPPADTEMVTSTAGAPDAPREQRDVLLGAFDGGPLLIQGTPYTQRRTGVRGGEVAPTNAHTVEETIARLNELDIEVLFLGTPIQGGLDTKPGITGVNGDLDSHIEGDKFDPTDATKVRPDFAPWFWMNATNTLTMPPVTSIPKAGRVTPTLFGGDSSLFWGVY